MIGLHTTLFFGGSFNPVHNAHLACCAAAARAGGFGRVVLVPSHQPVLKSNTYDLAPADHRLAMLRLAAEAASQGDLAFSVDPIELHRPGPTYTIDTAEALLRGSENGAGVARIDWLIGADQVLNLHRWHRFADLMQKVQFWVMHRPGYPIDWSGVDPAARHLERNTLEVPQLDISATEIRRYLREGLPIDALVPPKVREYILAHRLYIP